MKHSVKSSLDGSNDQKIDNDNAMEENITSEEMPSTDDNPPDPNLDSNTMDKQQYDQLMTNLKNQSSISMTNTVFAPYYQEINSNLKNFSGKEIELSGFIYKENGFKSNQFVIGRFLITHCIADSNLIGFLTEFNKEEELKKDTWVQAKGEIMIQEYNGVQMPVIKSPNGRKLRSLINRTFTRSTSKCSKKSAPEFYQSTSCLFEGS